MKDRTVPALLAIALVGALAFAAKTSHDAHEAKTRLDAANRDLRDAYVREATASHDPIAALRAIALDEKMGGDKQWVRPKAALRRALFEADFATRPGDSSIHLAEVPDTLLIGPEVGAPLHVFTSAGRSSATYDDDRGLSQGPSFLEEAWPDDPDLRVAVFFDQVSLTNHKGYSRKTIPLSAHIVSRTPHHLLLSRVDGSLVVLDQRTGDLREVGAFHGPAALSADGDHVIAYSVDDKLALVDLNGGKRVLLTGSSFVATKEGAAVVKGIVVEFWKRGAMVDYFHLSPRMLVGSRDGRYVLVAQENGRASLRNAETGAEIGAFNAGSDVTAAAFSDDGRHLAVGTARGDVFTYRTEDASFEDDMGRRERPIRAIAIARDLMHVATVTDDANLRVSRTYHPLVRSWTRPWLVDGRHVFSIAGGAISHQGFAAGQDRRFEYPEKDLDVEVDRAATTLVAYPRKASATPLRVFDMDSAAVRLSLDVPDGAAAVLSPNGKRLYVTANDRSTLYDLATNKAIGAVPTGVARFSSDGKRLAIGTKDKLTIWDEGGHEIGAKTGDYRPVAFAANDERLVVVPGVDFATLALLDSKSLEEIATLEVDLRNPPSFLAAGDTIALRASTSTRIIDARTGKKRRSIAGWMTATSLSPDGKHILVGDSDLMTIEDTHETAQDKAGLSFRENRYGDGLSSFALSDDGTRAAATFRASFVRVWDASTGEVDAVIPASREPGWVTLSRDGNELVFADGERERARAYDLSYERHLAFACKLTQTQSSTASDDVKTFCAAHVGPAH